MKNEKLGLSLVFSADTKAAKTEVEQLQKYLSKLSDSTTLKSRNFELTSEVREATRAATELEVALKSALNADTGQLDLSKLKAAFKNSGKTLRDYQTQLYMLGPEGEKAFLKLAKSITLAEIPLKKTNKLVDDLWQSLKNTAKWQLSSSVVHGFMGALQSAYGYAQDLNNSLNDIRIVTEMSTDQMSTFAKQANEAAKALSTTTTEYTKASLIFYQQGLSDKEVEERTNVTIKMANAAGTSAEKVSDQLTAVWNNFYDGSKSLEYYADVMTSLGAATASSTEEISEGLNKFAAIADTVGLSYEYAASALATVTATTRQSADVVGTAFKTLFARLQDLELGKTLDDGTSLGKYSAALNTVGVNIKDVNGDMKSMDAILNELGAKWQNLSKDTQAAVAQTVAGTRQYTQLIALMDNWKYFQQNLGVVQSSEGTLDKQASIYAESWEAAEKRVTAAAQKIYSQLLNDEFFIDLTNVFAGLLDGVSNFIDGIGGVKGALLSVASIVTTVFSKQIGTGISNAAHALKNIIPGSRQREELEMKKATNQLVVEGMKDSENLDAMAYNMLAIEQESYARNVERMSEGEKEVNQKIMDRNKLLAESVSKANEVVTQTKANLVIQRNAVKEQLKLGAKNTGANFEDLEKERIEIEKIYKGYSLLHSAAKEYAGVSYSKNTAEFKIIQQDIENLLADYAEFDGVLQSTEGYEALAKALRITTDDAKGLVEALREAENVEELNKALKGTAEDSVKIQANNKTADLLTKGFGEKITEEEKKAFEQYTTSIQTYTDAVGDASVKTSKLNRETQDHITKMYESKSAPIGYGEAISTAVGAVTGFMSALSALQGTLDTLNDSEASAGDKVVAVIGGITALIPLVISLAPAFSTATVGAKLFGAEAKKAGIAANLAMWQVTLIVAAITALIAGIAFLVTQESEAEKQAKKTAQAAEQMKESADEAAQSLEKIKNAFDAYDTAIEKLNQCTKGTEEWNEALSNVNKTVLEILQDIPELAGYIGLFTRDMETGMFTINEDQRQGILKEAEKKANITSALSVIAQARVAQSNANLTKDNLKQSIGNSFGVGGQQEVFYADVSVDEYADYVDLGHLLTENATSLLNLTEEEYRQKVKELIRDAVNDEAKMFEGFDAQVSSLVDSAAEHQDSLNSFAEQTQTAAEQIKNSYGLLVDLQLGNSYGGAEKTIAAAELKKRTDELEQIYLAKMTGADISIADDSNNAIYKEIAQKMSALGLGYGAATGNTVLGSDTNRRFIFIDETTGEKTEEKSAQWVASQIAAAEALKELSGSAENAKTALTNLDENIKKNSLNQDNAGAQQEAIRNFIANKNFESSNRKDFASLRFEIENSSTGDARADIEAYMTKMFGDENGVFTDEMAKKFGLGETAKEALDSFYKAFTTGINTWDSFELPEGLLGTEKLSIATADKISRLFHNINLGPEGEAAGTTFTEGLNKLLTNIDADSQQAALEQLINIDWSSWDALDQADVIMQQFGVHINTASDEWKTFAANMRTATGAMPDYSHIKQDLTEISAILEDLDFGSVISEDDYNRLIEYNNAWKAFFQMQANGTIKFIGNSDAMLAVTRDRIKEERKSLQTDVDIQNKLLKHWGSTNWSSYGTNIQGLSDLLGFYDNASIGGDTQAILSSLGYDKNILEEIKEEVNQGNTERLTQLYSRLSKLQNASYISDDKQLEEAYASTAKSYAELDEMFNNNEIGSSKTGEIGETTTYEKQATSITVANMQAAESLSQLNKAKEEGEKYGVAISDNEYFSHVERLAESAYGATKSLTELNSENSKYADAKLDDSIRTELYSENLQRLGESYGIATEELKNYRAALESGTDVATAETALKNAILLGEEAQKIGVDETELEELTLEIAKNFGEGFSNALNYASGFAYKAKELNITTEELINNLINLRTTFGLLTVKQANELFDSIADTATKAGLSVNDLTNTTVQLAEKFSTLTGEQAVDMATNFMVASRDYGMSVEELTIQTEQLSTSLEITSVAASRLAIQNQRMNKGMAALIENWEDWQKTLKSNDKTSTDYVKTVTEMTSAIKDLIGASDDFTLPEGFLDSEEHLKLIEEAAKGSAEAVNKLGLEITKEQIYDLEREAGHQEIINQDGTITKWSLSATAFNKAKQTIAKGIREIQHDLDNLEPGDPLDNLGPDWVQAMNDMALATNMSVEEMNSMLNQMGVDADIKLTNVEVDTQVPIYETEEKVVSEEGNLRKTQTKSTIVGYDTMKSVMQVPSINADADITYIGNGNVSTSTKATGGSTTKPQHVEDKKETKKRYETIDSKMENKANIIADTERSLDTMYGADRISQMKIVNSYLADEVELLREKNAEAKEYLKTDAGSVTTAFSAVGITDVTFDKNGNVQFPEGKDIEDYFETLDNDYATAVSNHNALIDRSWNDRVITKEEQASIDASKEALDEKSKKIDEARAAWDKYLETLGIVNDTEDKKIEKENEIKANNYQAIVDELTLATEKNADTLQEYDYYLNKVAEDYYNMAEAAGYMQNKLDTTQFNLTTYGNHYTSLEAKHSAGEISDADYYAGLAETKDAIYGELEALQSLDAEMLEYYSNTLSMAGEEIGKYTEKIEHLSSVLDHYQSLLSIIGKENDFESMGVVLSGIASTAKDAKDVAKAEYEFYAKQAEERKAAMDAATDDAAKEALKKEWEAAEAAANEAQDRMLSSTAEWAEAMKAVTENKLKDYAQTLEKTLTGGTSFDDLTTSMERANSLQEEYLTSTNQIYETSKMMRNTQKAIDETTNQVAKNKLKAFMEETKQLQTQDKLSQHQLDIHQAEYELLMAQIALEEAQSAKSTVRLQRDSEGNFGYVYTADSSQVADAEQKVANAQNALYNKQLEGANNYTQKYQQTLSEMYDTMSTLQEQYLNGEITSEEEYNQKMLEAKQYYFQKLQDFSELYQISTTGNSAVIADAWSSDFTNMTASTETWEIAVKDYTSNCASAFTGWKDVITEVEKETGEDLTSLSTKVSNITAKSKELATELTKDGGVIDKLKDELTAVTNVTNAYALQRSTLQDLIKTYEGYASTINTTLAGKKVITTITTETTDDSTQPPPTGMATGGYTGEWGPEGKLAILHEKEIVLNAQDTENLLAAVGTLRVILNAIDTHSMSAQIGGMLSTPGFTGGNSEVLEQNVKIEASFPGVQDRNEIEEAFNNLINRASQYANRK